MATRQNTLEEQVFTAAADLSAHQYNILYVSDGDKQVNVASEPANYAIAGVLTNKPAAAGRHASVAYRGPGKIRAGAAVNSTQTMLSTNGSGRAVAATSGDMVIGFALETAAADGDIISAELIPPFRLSGSPTR